jgi:O-antigen/teichoic acid export membrane protein
MDPSPRDPIYSKITSNVLYSLKGSLVTSASLFVMNLILARALPPLDLSFIFIVMSVIGILAAIAELGIPQAATVKLSERISKGISFQGVGDISSIIFSSFSIGMIVAILFVLGLFFISDFIPFSQASKDIAGALKISSLLIFFSSFVKISQGVFNGFQKMKYSFFLNITVEPLKFLLAVFALLFSLHWKELIWGLTFIYFLSFLFCAALLFIFLNKEKIDLNFGASQCKKAMLIQGLLLYSPILGSFLIPYILNLILARYGVEEVSYFALSLSLTSIYFVIFNAFSLALLPAATQLIVEEDKERLTNIVIVGAKYIGLGGFGILLVFYFFSDFILGFIYGTQYVKAQNVLKLLAFSVFFDIFKTICDPLLMGTKHGGVVTIIEWIKFGMVILLGSITIERFGLLGTGITLFLSFLTASSLKLFYIQRYLGIELLKPLMGMGCLLLGLLLYHLANIPLIVLAIIVAITIYLFKLWVWREVKYIWSLIRFSF